MILASLRANIAATIFGGLAAIFALIAVVQTVKLNGFLWIDGVQDKLETATTNLNECREGRKQDRATYEQAQRDAKAKNDADVARIKAEQDRISDNVQSNLNARLERLRSELRGKRTPAPQGNPGQPQAGPDGGPGPGTPQASGVCLTPEELLRAAENEERHDQLITWVERQLGVRR